MKLIPIKEVIQGNSIVICEDSIVRGTQLKNFTVKKLWDCGARQIHVRPACPPRSSRTVEKVLSSSSISTLKSS